MKYTGPTNVGGIMKLKNDETSKDPRLDRLIDFDPRNKNYPVRELVKTKKHRSYTWRCGIQLDQGHDGACVGFAVAHELAARPAEVKDIDEQYAKEAIYWDAQKIDSWVGGEYPGADPRYSGTSIIAGVKAAQRYGWFNEYRWAFGINDLILGVGHNGPAVIGVGWYSGMMEPDENDFINVSGNLLGGHAVLCNAVSVKKQRFTIHNSWGSSWGKNGECYISFDDMERLLDEEGEAVFFLKRHNLPKR